MSALDYAREVLREWESGDRYYPGSEDRLYSALHGLVAASGSNESSDAGPLGSGHSPRATDREAGDCGGSVEDPSTHLIHGPASESSDPS